MSIVTAFLWCIVFWTLITFGITLAIGATSLS